MAHFEASEMFSASLTVAVGQTWLDRLIG
jgi:hypothetical protein